MATKTATKTTKTTPAEVTAAEEAVRQYLFMVNGELHPDEKVVAKLQAAYDNETDPLKRLVAFTALSEGKMIDVSGITEAFVTAVPVWAQHYGVDGASIVEVHPNVSKADLRRAGLLKGRGSSGGTRRQGPSRDEIRAALPDSGQTFTIAEYAALSGSTPQTVSKVVHELLAEEVVVSQGTDKDRNSGPGKPPEVFLVV